MRNVLLLFPFLFPSFYLFGQSGNGLSARVTNEKGSVAAGATLSLLRTRDSGTLKFTAAVKDGRYAFDGLADGAYLVSATATSVRCPNNKVKSAGIESPTTRLKD